MSVSVGNKRYMAKLYESPLYELITLVFLKLWALLLWLGQPLLYCIGFHKNCVCGNLCPFVRPGTDVDKKLWFAIGVPVPPKGA